MVITVVDSFVTRLGGDVACYIYMLPFLFDDRFLSVDLPGLIANFLRVIRVTQPLPKTTFDFKMNKLNYALHGKLLDIGRRMDSLPDQTFLMEMQRVREAYADELNKIMEEHEAECNGN